MLNYQRVYHPHFAMMMQDDAGSCNFISFPIGSMYAIYGNIYHQYTPNVSIYTSTMDPMGLDSLKSRPFLKSFAAFV